MGNQGEGDGVARDIILEFFSEFVTPCKMGCTEVVPVIRHTMKKSYWKAVARLILYGLRVGYFPFQISPVFLISALFV